MRYHLVFGFLSFAIGGLAYYLIFTSTTWNPYLIWLLAWSTPAFVLYGLDKGLAKARGARVPEAILHLLAAVGGCAGAWLGMAVFRHKINFRKHPLIWTILILSTAGHAALIYLWLL
jgi:uncharacterized membrane protein YsdA (DUF1294 family)